MPKTATAPLHVSTRSWVWLPMKPWRLSWNTSLSADKLPTALPDGTYTDSVHNSVFSVVNGQLQGRLEPLASYIL